MDEYRTSGPMGFRKSTVVEVLTYFGKDVSITRYGFLRSPFRDEATPSFRITPSGRGWKDFGDGSGGGVIDLTMRLSGKDREGAIRILREIEGTERREAVQGIIAGHREAKGTGRLRICSSGPFTSGRLLSYVRSRGISGRCLERYCTEVTVMSGHAVAPPVPYIGFPNDGDGYVLRNERAGGHGKRCTCSAPTFIDADGSLSAAASCGRVAVFEGFFDFLSFIELYSPDTLAPGCDICVLNSITNYGRASRYILSHDKVELFLDNDRAGHATASAVISDMKSGDRPGRVIDRSADYAGYNDLNDFLVGMKKVPPKV